ncbi:glucose-6-phosphate 1-dehydrogenase [Caldicoprobacter guelmensis]|uniref:glucose-6-phosphate dehydrogenase n=1 Tax=Caldicoprobacter guelmensis TaxID=1170224 RepID=UPI001FAE946A|nr:glucose-6-phosphate dehydrogenase [Caldicoprobacter guelmensis]MBM7583242.1 glucose-6-phosphate 1-dehydrogenase [Caldicoprobacter guelmensis]
MNCLLVIFGGTGDLAHRKLYPAVYNLFVSGQLPQRFAVVSVGRREKTDEEFRQDAIEAIKRFSRPNSGTDEDLIAVVSRFYYHKLDITDTNGYMSLKEFLIKLDKLYGTQGNRLYYLAVAPEHFKVIVHNLKAADMVINDGLSWQRLVIEKPFGSDLNSAMALNNVITGVFSEKHIYRIDHYLGKEMLQNIMAIRFANALFEPLWNNKYIDHIQIISSETVGVENRGPYYEKAGALRDMIQNHMLQLLMLIAMEPPAKLDTESIRDEKVKVLKSLSEMTPAKVYRDVVRGQYGRGYIDGKPVVGYREESRVSPFSNTETFVAMKVEVENFRWGGVPFYLLTGKRLPERFTEVVIQFISLPEVLYFKELKGLKPNTLLIRIQPREGVELYFNAKKPGVKNEIIQVGMDFCQNCAVDAISPDAYERLLLDAMKGDSALFTRWDEVEYAWRFVDNIAKVWAEEEPDFPNYPAGTWGPPAAKELIERDGRRWRMME